MAIFPYAVQYTFILNIISCTEISILIYKTKPTSRWTWGWRTPINSLCFWWISNIAEVQDKSWWEGSEKVLRRWHQLTCSVEKQQSQLLKRNPWGNKRLIIMTMCEHIRGRTPCWWAMLINFIPERRTCRLPSSWNWHRNASCIISHWNN